MHKIFQHVHSENLKRLGGVLILVLLALVPFHALFTVWGGTLIGRRELVAIWKEVLILLIVGLALVVSLPSVFRNGWREVLRQPAVVLVGLIILAGLLANMLNANYGMAFFVGVKTTVVPLLLFLAVQPFAHNISERRLTDRKRKNQSHHATWQDCPQVKAELNILWQKSSLRRSGSRFICSLHVCF